MLPHDGVGNSVASKRKRDDILPFNYDNSRVAGRSIYIHRETQELIRAFYIGTVPRTRADCSDDDRIRDAFMRVPRRGCTWELTIRRAANGLLNFCWLPRPIAGDHLVPPSFSFSLTT